MECTEHENTCSLVCVTCDNKLICIECVDDHPKEHHFSSIKAIAKRLKSEKQNLLRSIDEDVSTLKKEIAAVRATQKQQDDLETEENQKINDQRAAFHSIIDQFADSQLQFSGTQKMKNIKMLQDDEEFLTKQLQERLAYGKAVKHIIDSADEIEMLQKTTEMMPLSFPPTPLQPLKFCPGNINEDQIRFMFGRMTDSPEEVEVVSDFVGTIYLKSPDTDDSKEQGPVRTFVIDSMNTSMKPAESRPCLICGKQGQFQCGRCKSPYCTSYCQRTHWIIHRRVCEQLTKGIDSNCKDDGVIGTEVVKTPYEEMKNPRSQQPAHSENKAQGSLGDLWQDLKQVPDTPYLSPVHHQDHGSYTLQKPEESRLKLNGLDIKIYMENILQLDVDCIVNAANENLQHGGGLSHVISIAAGYEFDKESWAFIVQNGPLAVGECCTTTAGRLRYKGVIHAVGPRWRPNDQTNCLKELEEAVTNTLLMCDFQGYKSVAIPAISSGIFGVPKELCAQQYYRGMEEYSKQRKNPYSLREVHFVDKDQGMVDLIQRTFRDNMG